MTGNNKNKEKQQEEQKQKYNYTVTPDALMDDESLPIKAKHLWAVEYRYCKNKSSQHPSTTYSMDFFAEKMFDVNENGEKISTSKRSVQRWKRLLEKRGWQREKRRFNNTSIIILNKVREIPPTEKTPRGRYDTHVTSTSIDLLRQLEG